MRQKTISLDREHQSEACNRLQASLCCPLCHLHRPYRLGSTLRETFPIPREGRDIVCADQRPRRQVHRHDIERAAPVPHRTASEGWLNLAVPDMVPILPPCRVVAGMEPVWHDGEIHHTHIGQQHPVQTLPPRLRLTLAMHISVHHLPDRVNPGVCPTGEERPNRLAIECRKRPLDIALHRPLPRLNLRSRERCAIVGKRQSEPVYDDLYSINRKTTIGAPSPWR